MKYILLSTAFIATAIFASNAIAQNQAQPVAASVPAPVAEQPSVTQEKPAEKGTRKFNADTFPSLLFTYWEQVAIEDARRSRGLNRAPTDAELMRDLKTEEDDLNIKDPGRRDIELSGIAYKATKNWTIWLNGQRVTPDAIPEEALDLKVFKEYIEIKWFDEYTNRIIPIRLRPHQRFNIDTRIFLPG